eukprot:TRINITY_DN4232_c1_g1_i1.p2 TRINITY_DN4232_c1_g1~~TRINITY_DN4232_c1_g1_i1.p2  ORF type:complete len:202 (+),score=37.37 TRINITY_DN4232_c1_g1_i1:377-982(+)
MFIVYLLMLLLIPIHGNGNGSRVHLANMFSIVRTYFALKAFCNFCFSIAALFLLSLLRVDLAFVIATICFTIQFIPEIGAIISLIMPVPIILLDGRREFQERCVAASIAVIGMLLIKFLVSNIGESILMSKIPSLADLRDEQGKLIKLQEEHPVIILFVALVMGSIWGAAGMLIAVPLLSIFRLVMTLEKRATSKSRLHAH